MEAVIKLSLGSDSHTADVTQRLSAPTRKRNLNPTMVRKRFQAAKTGFQLVKSIKVNQYLKKIGLGREDWPFWKYVGKSLLGVYAVAGAAWLYNETSPLGWWNVQPRAKEEWELAHLYEKRQFPYPGDEKAMDDFVANGGMIGTRIDPKDSFTYYQELEDEKFQREALKLWMRMRNEVIAELQEKGYDVE